MLDILFIKYKNLKMTNMNWHRYPQIFLTLSKFPAFV
jgi:hypothetical protein